VQDELNITDDINDILDYIEWNEVSYEIGLEFFMKFYGIFEGEDCENKIIVGIQRNLIRREEKDNESKSKYN